MIKELSLHGIYKVEVSQHRTGLDFTMYDDKGRKFVLSLYSPRIGDQDKNKTITLEIENKFQGDNYDD